MLGMDNNNSANPLPAAQTAPGQDKEVANPEPALIQPAEKEAAIINDDIKEEAPLPINLPAVEETPIHAETAGPPTPSPPSATGDNFLNDEMPNKPEDRGLDKPSDNADPVAELRQNPDQELPHQPSDLKPEDIIEPEQAPLEEIITAAEKAKAAVQDESGVVPRDRLKPGQKQPDEYPGERPSPKLEEKFQAHHEEKKKTLSEIKERPEPKEEKNFISQYLRKLTEFRAQANQKRSSQVEANLEVIMNFAGQKQKITNNDVEKLTGVKHAQATRYLSKLAKKKLLIKFGTKSNIFYKPTKY